MAGPSCMLFNRASGERRRAADAFIQSCGSRGIETLDIDHERDLFGAIRSRFERGVRLFIAGGGDGTIHHVLQPLVNTEAILGVVPMGTFNHLAKDLGIPLVWEEALEVALHGTERQVDVGRITDRFFVNNISFGLYPELVARREEKGRDYPRWKARLRAAVATLHKYPHVTLELESEHHHEILKTHVLMISNNSYDLSRMGISSGRDQLNEGSLSVYWLPHLSRWQLMQFGAHYLAGRVQKAPGFRSFRTRSLKLQSPRRSIQLGIDGEIMTAAMPAVITTVPSSLLIRVPKSWKRILAP